MNRFLLYIITCSYLLFSCNHEDVIQNDSTPERFKVGVFMPLSGNMAGKWETGLNWAVQNVNQAGGVAGREVEIVWYDSQEEDIESVAQEIALDTSIVAAIGPFTSHNAFLSAPYFIENKKLMFTIASSSELTRAYSNKNYIWRLVESDISQCKAMVLKARQRGIKRIGLICGNDEYGVSFYNWLGFFASELSMEVTRVERYPAVNSNIEQNIRKVLDSDPELIVCVPSNIDHAKQIIQVRNFINPGVDLLFSDIVYMPEFVNELGELSNGIEGTVMIPNPENGFRKKYLEKFGENALLGMAQIYDAMMLICFGLEVSGGEIGESLLNGVKKVVDGRDGYCGWDRDGIQKALELYRKGVTPDIIGASGELVFDSEFYFEVVSSVYAYWRITDQKFELHEYLMSDNELPRTNMASAWRTFATQIDSLNVGRQREMPNRTGLKAVLLCTSKGWTNYRHQADLLAFYQLLKDQGMQDEDIICIAQDDLAYADRNIYLGEVRNSNNGENLYDKVEIDYTMEDLSVSDIFDILLGKHKENTPNILTPDAHTDVLLYIVDHGSPEGIIVENKQNEVISPQVFGDFICQFNESCSYRSMLVVVEACYSGKIGFEVDIDAPIVCITAANENETSKAINYSDKLNTWLSNNFTNALLDELASDPKQSISQLYISLNKKVNGSHVSIYNEQNFGNLGQVEIEQFINP